MTNGGDQGISLHPSTINNYLNYDCDSLAIANPTILQDLRRKSTSTEVSNGIEVNNSVEPTIDYSVMHMVTMETPS